MSSRPMRWAGDGRRVGSGKGVKGVKGVELPGGPIGGEVHLGRDGTGGVGGVGAGTQQPVPAHRRERGSGCGSFTRDRFCDATDGQEFG